MKKGLPWVCSLRTRTSSGSDPFPGPAERRVDELLHPVVVEAADRQAGDTFLPAQVGQVFGERVPASEFGVAVGADDQDPTEATAPDQVHQSLESRPSGPMQVVEDQQHRATLAFLGEPVGEAVEQGQGVGGPAGGIFAQLGGEAGQHPAAQFE